MCGGMLPAYLVVIIHREEFEMASEQTQRRATIRIASFITGIALAAAVAAQPQTPRGPAGFHTFDQDGDGVITEQEFTTVREERRSQRAQTGAPMWGAAGAPAFADFDSDGDGRVTPQEFSDVQRQRMQSRPGMGYGGGPGMGQGMGPGMGPGMTGPGMMGPGTGPGASPGMMGPGMMGPGMMGPGMGRGMQMPEFTDFDIDGDGRLTAQEFYQSRAQRMADRAGQGYPLRNAPNAPSFESIDQNGDGSVGPEEFRDAVSAHHQGWPSRQ